MSFCASVVASRSFLSGSFQADRSCLHCRSVLPSTPFFNVNPWTFTTDADVQDFLLVMALSGLMRCMSCNVQVTLAPSSLWMVICATFTQYRTPLQANKHLRTEAFRQLCFDYAMQHVGGYSVASAQREKAETCRISCIWAVYGLLTPLARHIIQLSCPTLPRDDVGYADIVAPLVLSETVQQLRMTPWPVLVYDPQLHARLKASIMGTVGIPYSEGRNTSPVCSIQMHLKVRSLDMIDRTVVRLRTSKMESG